MTDQLPPSPAPLPPPDRHQIDRLNRLYNLSASEPRDGWTGGLIDKAQNMVSRLLSRQRAFNAVLVDHINRNDLVGIEAHHASAKTVAWVRDTVQFALEELRRHQQALAAWERRTNAAVAALSDTHEELRASIGVLQQATQTLKREVVRLSEAGIPTSAAPTTERESSRDGGSRASLDGHKYVGFEDHFRGSQDDIRGRVAEYLPIFRGVQNVVDLGCGRGEFLALLRENGIDGRGVDINEAMVEVCRSHGFDVTRTDALSYLEAQPDGSIGGLFAAQVVEHLEPQYLNALLDVAFGKLRPGAPIVLETINPACWFAFFESYIRDITHVRPLHPDTLKFLLIASGFQHVDIRYRSPYPEHEKLQPIGPNGSLGDAVETLNANVERINRLLFTWLDYAAIGRRA
ncbi:MAG: class I SAM-dependent methyltransferase [Vicinamibacterales bacterium]